jgi:hypothetical protein
VAGALGEEVGVSDLLVPDRLLQRDGRDLGQPGQVRYGFHGGQVGVALTISEPVILGIFQNALNRQVRLDQQAKIVSARAGLTPATHPWVNGRPSESGALRDPHVG